MLCNSLLRCKALKWHVWQTFILVPWLATYCESPKTAHFIYSRSKKNFNLFQSLNGSWNFLYFFQIQMMIIRLTIQNDKVRQIWLLLWFREDFNIPWTMNGLFFHSFRGFNLITFCNILLTQKVPRPQKAIGGFKKKLMNSLHQI